MGTPVVLAIREAEVGGSLECMSSRPDFESKKGCILGHNGSVLPICY